MERIKSEEEAAMMTDAEYMRKRLLENREATEKHANMADVAKKADAMRLKIRKTKIRVSMILKQSLWASINLWQGHTSQITYPSPCVS